MANMFAQIASKATSLSPLMKGREKLATQEVIENYPDGITIINFDVVSTSDNMGNIKTYPIIQFAEDDTKFIYGGKALMDIVNAWLAHMDGDIETTVAALKADGGVKVILSQQRTRNGNNFTKVDVVG